METGLLLRIDLSLEVEKEMKDQEYLKLANEAGRKIKEINHLIGGTECPEEGSLLGNVVCCVHSMIQIHLAPIVWKAIDSDELSNMATQIMFAGEEEINNIIQKVISSSHER